MEEEANVELDPAESQPLNANGSGEGLNSDGQLNGEPDSLDWDSSLNMAGAMLKTLFLRC